MRYVVLFFILFSFQLFAQKDYSFVEVDTPFDPQSHHNTNCIKIKSLPYPNGNGYGINNSLGFEIGFFKNNSIGVDGFYNYAFDQDDNNPGVTDLNPTYLYEKAIQINYKYYYSFQNIRKAKKIVFYNGLFSRIEKLNREGTNYYQNTDKKALGVTIGMIKKIKSTHLGLDYSILLGRQFNNITTFDPVHNSETITFENKNSFYFNVAISLNYWFK